MPLIHGAPAHLAHSALGPARPALPSGCERHILALVLKTSLPTTPVPSLLRPCAPAPRRWRATPVRLDEWAAWFKEQAALANAPLDRGLFIGLRLDGRVRASGTGCPPWQKFALQLPPTEGFFGG